MVELNLLHVCHTCTSMLGVNCLFDLSNDQINSLMEKKSKEYNYLLVIDFISSYFT